MKQNKKLLFGAVGLLIALALFAGIWFVSAPQGTAGSKAIHVSVVHADGATNAFELSTDAEFLRGALEEAALVEGLESDYGLYILTVDGETVDEANQEWWCVTQSGEMLMTGVDSTPIADGDTYEITLIVGY